MAELKNSPNLFRTSETPLAVWLYISGVKLIQTDTEQTPAVFIFERESDISIEDLCLKWENGIADGNVRAFYKTYKNFLKRIKGGPNG